MNYGSAIEKLILGFEDLKLELRDMRSNMATKSDIAEIHINIAGIRSEIATNEMATKASIADIHSNMATKDDIADFRSSMAINIADIYSEMATKTDIADINVRMANRQDMADIGVRLTTLRSEMKSDLQEGLDDLARRVNAEFRRMENNMAKQGDVDILTARVDIIESELGIQL